MAKGAKAARERAAAMADETKVTLRRSEREATRRLRKLESDLDVAMRAERKRRRQLETATADGEGQAFHASWRPPARSSVISSGSSASSCARSRVRQRRPRARCSSGQRRHWGTWGTGVATRPARRRTPRRTSAEAWLGRSSRLRRRRSRRASAQRGPVGGTVRSE